jgi:hypothetical protein
VIERLEFTRKIIIRELSAHFNNVIARALLIFARHLRRTAFVAVQVSNLPVHLEIASSERASAFLAMTFNKI